MTMRIPTLKAEYNLRNTALRKFPTSTTATPCSKMSMTMRTGPTIVERKILEFSVIPMQKIAGSRRTKRSPPARKLSKSTKWRLPLRTTVVTIQLLPVTILLTPLTTARKKNQNTKQHLIPLKHPGSIMIKKTEEKPSDEGWANFDDMSSDKPTETTEEKLPERAQNYSVEKDEPMKDEQTKEEPMKTEETKTEEMKTEEAVVEKSDEMKQDNESSSMEVQPMQVTTTDKTDNDVITSAKSSSVDADDVTMQTDDVGVTSEEKGDSNAA